MNRARAYRLASVAFVLVVLVVISAAVAAAVERPPVAPLALAGSGKPYSYVKRAELHTEGSFTPIAAAGDPARERVFLSHYGGPFYDPNIMVINSTTATSMGTIYNDLYASPLVLNPDGSRLFAYTPYENNRHVYVYNTSTLAEVNNYPVATPLHDMVASSRGRLYTSGGLFTNRAVHVYDAQTGAELAQIPQPGDAYLAVHGDRLYAAINKQYGPYWMTLAAYDISGPTPVALYSTQYEYGTIELDVSPDGTFLVGRNSDGYSVDVYDTADLSHLARLDPRNDGAPDHLHVGGVAISTDGELIHLHDVRHVYSYNSASYELERFYRHPYHSDTVLLTPLAGQDIMLGDNDTVRFYAPERGRAHLACLTYNYCRSYISDDFSNPASGWPVGDSGDVRYAYENGQYRMLFREKEIMSIVTRGDVWNQSRMVAIEGQVAAGSGWWGLVFYINSDWSRFYTLEIMPAEQLYIWTSYSATKGFILLDYGTRGAIRTGSAWNRIEVTSNPYGTVIVTINGVSIPRPIPNYGVGRMGLTASSLERDTDFRFDNYVFAAKNCPIPGETPSAQSVEPPVEMSRPPMLEGGR